MVAHIMPTLVLSNSLCFSSQLFSSYTFDIISLGLSHLSLLFDTFPALFAVLYLLLLSPHPVSLISVTFGLFFVVLPFLMVTPGIMLLSFIHHEEDVS